jgi:Ni,Fe-hydrogenase III small subunit
MRQRLLQVPEYRALAALDHSIHEICAILQESLSVAAPEPVAPPQAAIPEAAPPRPSAIATAFAETLAAKIDQRNGARTASHQPVSRVHAG